MWLSLFADTLEFYGLLFEKAGESDERDEHLLDLSGFDLSRERISGECDHPARLQVIAHCLQKLQRTCLAADVLRKRASTNSVPEQPHSLSKLSIIDLRSTKIDDSSLRALMPQLSSLLKLSDPHKVRAATPAHAD